MSEPDIAAFYHVYASGQWQPALDEYFEALQESEYFGPLTVGIIGKPSERFDVLDRIDEHGWEPDYVTAERGYEQLTLASLREYADSHDGVVMYAHTKGAAFPSEHQDEWRRRMVEHVVVPWRINAWRIDELGYDAVGCHWLVPGDWPGPFENAHFSGNIWIASCAYLRRLPPCANSHRHAAEMWIGKGDPKVYVPVPGWGGTPQQVAGNRGTGG